jgi:outer membrane protein assembly factor BamD
MILKKELVSISLVIFIQGCSEKELTNQSDRFWYNEMVKTVELRDLDRADENFLSLETEHIKSPLLKTATMIMINSHIRGENYILAGYYMDKYNSYFSSREDREYIAYLRIKSKYLSLYRPLRDQKLLLDAIELVENYKHDYFDSKYLPLVKTMGTNLILSKSSLNLLTADLYKRLDKPEAVKYVLNDKDLNWFDANKTKKPNISFFRALFE